MAFLVWHGTEGYRTGVLCCNVLCDDCTVFQLTHRLHWQLGSRTCSSRAQSSSPHYSCSFQLLQQLQVRRQITHCDAKSDRVTTVYDMHWHTNLIPSVIYIYQLSNFASLHMPLPQPLQELVCQWQLAFQYTPICRPYHRTCGLDCKVLWKMPDMDGHHTWTSKIMITGVGVREVHCQTRKGHQTSSCNHS